jgi:hypothetical protein
MKMTAKSALPPHTCRDNSKKTPQATDWAIKTKTGVGHITQPGFCSKYDKIVQFYCLSD